MSRSITQTSSSSSTVAAGSSVIVPVNTTTGFSAGDYVYTLPNGGVGTRATGNVSIGADTPYVGTSFINTGLQSVSFRSASYGPYIDQATFTGTNRTFAAVQIAANTVKTAYAGKIRTCTLANGNVVLMYTNGGTTLYFKVINSTGSTVVAETTLSTTLQNSTISGNFACCTLVSGNIQFVWTNNAGAYEIYSAQYSPAGAVVIAGRNISSGIANPGNFSIAALSGGGSVLLSSNGLTSIIYNPYVHILTATGDYGSSFTASYGVGGGGQYYVGVVGLPSSYGTNIWAYFSQSTLTSAGPYTGVLGVYSGSTAVTSTFAGGGVTGTSGGETFNITFSTDGYIVCPVYNGSIYAQKFLYTKTTNTTGSVAYSSGAFINSGNSATFSAMANGMVSSVANNGNNITMSTISSSNVVSSDTTVATAITQPTGVGDHGCFCAASFGSGLVSIFYQAISTYYPSQIGAATIAATNGVTTLTGASTYLPSDGYYLMGVAATDAAANTTGQVIINGTAQLGSSYPTVTTPIYYSYQTTASQPIFGQRGSVNATTVTLKGLEA